MKAQPRFPGWRTMSGAARRNARMAEIFEQARTLSHMIPRKGIQYRDCDLMTLEGLAESERLSAAGWTRYASSVFRDRYVKR